jgi:NAD(P)-dependent dehydrogenase (short-subunit alcohol dehydrogenase family)
MAPRLEGLSAFVTGSSSGNGRAIALALAREGAKVLCADLSPLPTKAGVEETEDATHELIVKQGGSADFYKVNVVNSEEFQAAIDKAVSLYGRLDILVNKSAFTLAHDEGSDHSKVLACSVPLSHL